MTKLSNQKITATISGMHCASCARTIERTLKKQPGIRSASVNYALESIKMEIAPGETSLDSVNQELEKLGYALHADVADSLESETPEAIDLDSSTIQKRAELATLKTQVLVSLPMVVITIVVMIWELFSKNFGLFAQMPATLEKFFHQLWPIFATYMLFSIGATYIQALLRFFKHRVANMETLVGMGTSTAFIYSFFVTALSDVLKPFLDTTQHYYDVTIVVIGFVVLGKYLEMRSRLHTNRAIERLVQLQPKTATVIGPKNEQKVVAIQDLAVGDMMLIKPGERIPADGTIVEGATAIDESHISGEPLPVEKSVGGSVVAGSINTYGSLIVRATKVGTQTLLSQIISLVKEAQGSKAPIEKLVDRIASVFVPLVMVLSLLSFGMWILVGIFFLPFSQAFTMGLLSFVSVLVIACPCAMGLATPLAVIAGVGRAAENGILIKNAEILQKLTQVTTLILDKTGTVTEGKPSLSKFVLQDSEIDEKTAVQLLYSLESRSEHPLAKAVVAYAKKHHIQAKKVEKFRQIAGLGVTGSIDKKQYSAGSLRLLQSIGIQTNSSQAISELKEGATQIFLCSESKVLGYAIITDSIKQESLQLVEQLKKQHIQVTLLSGDAESSVAFVANELGIASYQAGMLPADKLSHIKKLQAEGGVVAMVGDGTNDAPALAQADIGIALGTGSDIAIESAGATLISGNIAQIPKVFSISHATLRTIKQNLFWAFGYNAILLPVAMGVLYPFTGSVLSPALAGAAMAFSSISVVLNSARLQRKRL